MSRPQYRATLHRESCPICNENIRRGMPIVYVPARYYDTPGKPKTVPIHARCERSYDLEHS